MAEGNGGGIGTRMGGARDGIVTRWVELVSPALRGRSTQQELRGELGELFGAVVDAVQAGGSFRGRDYEEVRARLAELSRLRARQGFSPTETAGVILSLKQAIVDTLALDSAADVMVVAGLVDDLAVFTFESFVAARESVVTQQSEQLLELSTPVVKLWDGILAVPLVGTLDSARTQVVMEKLLETLVDTGSDQAIIDITGVPAVDTQVAQHLLKTVVAARLMGAKCVISGIRPQIAQTVVALGIDFENIDTKASLADALLLALQRRGMRVVPVAGSDG